MPAPIYRGNLLPQLQRYTGRWNPVTGFTYDQEYRGLDENAMRSLAFAFAASGCEYEFTMQLGVATLRTTDTRGNVTIDTWEIGVNQQLISEVRNPIYKSGDDPIVDEDLFIIKWAIEKGLTLDEAYDELNASEDFTTRYPRALPVVEPRACRLYDRMKKGEDSFRFDQYSLRHTTNVSNRWHVNVADINKECIYTPARLLSEVTNPRSWIFPLPGRLVYKINSIFNAMPAPVYNDPDTGNLVADPYHIKGALKSASPESTAANTRVNIVTTYDLAVICTETYQMAT